MKEQLISVIIPVYNVALYLDECLKTVCGQTYHNIEIILIDDGSTDGSAKICDEWKKRDSRIQVIHKANEGVSVARNTGLEIAQGAYIAFVDADDWLEYNMYEEMYRQAWNHNADVIICEESVDEAIKEISVLTGEAAIKDILTDTRPLRVNVWNKLFRVELLRYIRFLPEIILGEDFLFVVETLLNASKCIWINKRLYHYRERTGSALRSAWSLKKERDEIWVRNRMLGLFMTNESLIKDGRCELLRMVLDHYLKCFDREFLVKEEKKKTLRLLQQEARKIPLGTTDEVNTNIRHMLLRLNAPIYVWVSKMYFYMKTRVIKEHNMKQLGL